MFDNLFSAALNIVKLNSRHDDDLVDRLHHRYTVSVLVVFAVLVSTTQYVGTPIHCWCPAYFTGNHQQYTNKVCWVSYTYYLPDNTVAGQSGAVKQYLSYYQWVPMFLLVQAFLFYVPSLFWRVFSERSGINVHNLVEAADTIQNALYPERRDKTIKYMIRHLDHYLQYQREYRGGCCACAKRCLARHSCLVCGNRYGNYLVMLYLTTKILYFANAVLQIFLLDAFLATDYRAYGIEVLVDLWTGGRVWGGASRSSRSSVQQLVRRFPRVTLCDFEIRQMGNTHRHTVQCVLPVNLFNEKIYAFLWFWFALVSASTLVSLFRWTWTIGFRYSRTWYVRKHLKVTDRYSGSTASDRERKAAAAFAESYLRQDGIFVLKLVAKNSTDLVVADIVAALWDNYRYRPPGGGAGIGGGAANYGDVDAGEDGGDAGAFP